jgi:DNA-binding beta-propeller fold protein YncE
MFPRDVTVDPAGRHAYVPSAETGAVYHYTILPSGLLEPAPVASFSTGGSPEGLAIHPSGAFAYAAGPGGRFVYAANASSGLQLSTGERPMAITAAAIFQ